VAYQQRRMFDVRHLGLKCASCGAEIAELPFQPSGDRPVYCRECAREQRKSSGGPRGGGGPRRRF